MARVQERLPDPAASDLGSVTGVRGAPSSGGTPRVTPSSGGTPVVRTAWGTTIASLEPALASMPYTRRVLLVALKHHGSATAADLSEELDLTVSAIRQQMLHLSEDGLVIGEPEVVEGRGRPILRYRLAPAAEALFPKRYDDFTSELLGFLGGPGSVAVDRLFEHRRHQRLAAAQTRLGERPLGERPLGERVAELTRILDEDGYLAELIELDGGGWRIVEHNCAILGVATGFRQACSSELGFIRDALPDAHVQRVAHLMAGAHVCAYEVRPAPQPAPQPADRPARDRPAPSGRARQPHSA